MCSELFNYLWCNSLYFLLTYLVLFFWDLIDLYNVEGSLYFLRNGTFWFFNLTRGFFCVAVMEIAWNLNLFNLSTKYLLAFITPLLFTVFLQNLLVVIGQADVNVGLIFNKFRDSVLKSFAKSLDLEFVEAKDWLLKSNKSIEELGKDCHIILGDGFVMLESLLNGKDDEEKKIGYVEVIIGRIMDQRPPEGVKKYVIKKYSQ